MMIVYNHVCLKNGPQIKAARRERTLCMTRPPSAPVPSFRPTVRSSNNARRGKVLTYDTIAECVKKCQYAVRGEIYLAATERIKAGKEVIFTNVGNPHGLGQKPLTFLRQVRDGGGDASGEAGVWDLGIFCL